MSNFKIAMVQHCASVADIATNTRLAIDFIKQAKNKDADVVLFPECFLTAYYAPDICQTRKPVSEIESHPEFVKWCENALSDDSESLNLIRKTAKELQIGVAITCFTKGIKYPQNTAYMINRNGEMILKYSKVHTCDFDWERYLESGTEFRVCEFDGICLGVMICYDREYPESARELMLQGAEMILVPNDCENMKPRLMELSVASLQNMVGVAMANPPGANAGCSCAYHPMVWDDNNPSFDNTIVTATADFDGIVYANFDLQAIRAYRNSEDLGKYRKVQAYKHLTT